MTNWNERYAKSKKKKKFWEEDNDPDEGDHSKLTSEQKAKAKADTMAKAHSDVVKKDMATGDFTKSKASHAKIVKLDRGVLKAGQKLQKKHAADIEKATQSANDAMAIFENAMVKIMRNQEENN